MYFYVGPIIIFYESIHLQLHEASDRNYIEEELIWQHHRIFNEKIKRYTNRQITHSNYDQQSIFNDSLDKEISSWGSSNIYSLQKTTKIYSHLPNNHLNHNSNVVIKYNLQKPFKVFLNSSKQRSSQSNLPNKLKVGFNQISSEAVAIKDPVDAIINRKKHQLIKKRAQSNKPKQVNISLQLPKSLQHKNSSIHNLNNVNYSNTKKYHQIDQNKNNHNKINICEKKNIPFTRVQKQQLRAKLLKMKHRLLLLNKKSTKVNFLNVVI